MLSADRLLALLGRHADDPKIEAAFVELGTVRRPQLDPEDRNTTNDFVLIRRQGVELGFVDEVFFRAGPPTKRRRKDVPLILYQIYFYTKLGDISSFAGKLPFDLEWSDTRESVRQKLSQFESSHRAYIKDVWTLPQFQLVVEYPKKGSGLFSILCQLPLQPWPEVGRVQPSLGVADWVSLFGLPVSSPALHERLLPLDLASILASSEDVHEIDFRLQCGLQMVFTQAKNLKMEKTSALTRSKDLVLGAVRFLRSRELDARQWTGELPEQIAFDDTQVGLIEKVGRPPDEQDDDRLDGFALWHQPGYDLHVQYNNVENHLTQITLMAPGYWS